MITELSTVWFENPRDGQRFRILSLPDARHPGRFLLEYVYRPMTGETAVPPHFHPSSTETFEILAGQATYRIGEVTATARVGDRVVMPAGRVHIHPWSSGPEPLHVRQTGETLPADPGGILASLQAQVTLFGLAAAGKVNRKGLPSLLQLAVLARSTMPATYLDRPPVPVQRLAFRLLGSIGALMGYQTAYPEYGIVYPGGLEVPAPNCELATSS
jgi:mannose-6-phosphate isomerase-like protein (cupin superfamily)